MFINSRNNTVIRKTPFGPVFILFLVYSILNTKSTKRSNAWSVLWGNNTGSTFNYGLEMTKRSKQSFITIGMSTQFKLLFFMVCDITDVRTANSICFPFVPFDTSALLFLAGNSNSNTFQVGGLKCVISIFHFIH